MGKKTKKFIRHIVTLMMVYSAFAQVAFAERPGMAEAFNAFNVEVRYIFSGITAIALLTSIVTFIIHFIKLATTPSHPILRRAIMMNLVKSGICTMLLGAVNLIVLILFRTVY